MCYLYATYTSFAHIVLIEDDASAAFNFFVTHFCEGLTSSTAVRVTSKPTQARGVFCKDSSKRLNIFFAIALASPRGKVDCGRN